MTEIDNIRHAWNRACLVGDTVALEELAIDNVVIKHLGGDGLCVACRASHECIVEWLLTHGVDAAHDDNLPLLIACEYGSVELVGLLLSEGADIASRGYEGLLRAAYCERALVVQHLCYNYDIPKEVMVKAARLTSITGDGITLDYLINCIRSGARNVIINVGSEGRPSIDLRNP